jgi:hypothetical protein
MGLQVTAGATLACTFGLAPSTLVVLPVNRVLAKSPAGNLSDIAPVMNLPPFGACTSMANPAVAAATAAAMGVLTPQPCVPVPAGTWIPGGVKVVLGGMPAIDSGASAMCAWGGKISVLNPGQFGVNNG